MSRRKSTSRKLERIYFFFQRFDRNFITVMNARGGICIFFFLFSSTGNETRGGGDTSARVFVNNNCEHRVCKTTKFAKRDTASSRQNSHHRTYNSRSGRPHPVLLRDLLLNWIYGEGAFDFVVDSLRPQPPAFVCMENWLMERADGLFNGSLRPANASPRLCAPMRNRVRVRYTS